MKFRDYQNKIINYATNVIAIRNFVYLAMEVRTGKTLTSLGIAQKVGVKNVLFLTKKKAISSIESDYELLNPNYEITVINYESIHKVPKKGWDFVILDEAHTLGAFPKPSKRARQVRDILSLNRSLVCLLSGTPTPESYSQMYHQVYGIPGNPFEKYKNFYRFCDDHVNKVQKRINGFMVTDYSNGRESINNNMKPFMVSYTQKQAGFESAIEEEILKVPLHSNTYNLCRRLKKDLIIEMKEGEVILADTGVKLMSKLHQMYSGTVKFESGNSMIIDTSKARYIKWKFICLSVVLYCLSFHISPCCLCAYDTRFQNPEPLDKLSHLSSFNTFYNCFSICRSSSPIIFLSGMFNLLNLNRSF